VNVFQNVGVFDFCADISGGEIKHVLHPDQISRARVLLKILPVGLDDGIVDVPDVAEFPASRVDGHRTRHTRLPKLWKISYLELSQVTSQ
jgi:hypothetical protein